MVGCFNNNNFIQYSHLLVVFPYNENTDNAEAILPAPPRTREYRLSDEDMAEPNLELDEESNPASQLEPRHKLAATATQRNERSNPSRQSPPKVTNLWQTSRRKGEGITSAFEFKKRKTEESILKLKTHLEEKTCPMSFQYKARANVTPDDMFQKEIGAIKQYAEKQFVEALLRFRHRRLESREKKLERAKYAKHRNKRFISSRTESQSPSTNIANNVTNDVKRICNPEKQLFMYTFAKQQ